MTESNDMSDEAGSKGQLARADRPWRGDEHALQVAAAREAGLPAGQTAIDLYTEGFRRGLQERDPADGAIVLRGRTVLRAEEMMRSLKPMLRFLRIGPDAIGLRVVEGEFELRVAGQAADASEPVQGAVRMVLLISDRQRAHRLRPAPGRLADGGAAGLGRGPARRRVGAAARAGQRAHDAGGPPRGGARDPRP
ncbi:hypothetical protein [Nannocystis pusilla]|uniref:hypothetical protein n=1 Tax=Nannocystis pusilla TaxID=889268 RepID=UPI003DA32293